MVTIVSATVALIQQSSIIYSNFPTCSIFIFFMKVPFHEFIHDDVLLDMCVGCLIVGLLIDINSV